MDKKIVPYTLVGGYQKEKSKIKNQFNNNNNKKYQNGKSHSLSGCWF